MSKLVPRRDTASAPPRGAPPFSPSLVVARLLVTAAWLLASVPAWAQPAEGPPARPASPAGSAAADPAKPWAVGVSAERKRIALALYKTGNGHFEESRYSQALAEYLKAIRHWDHPAIRYNLAVCYINLDRTMEAYDSLQKALRFGAEPLGRHHKQALTYLRLVRGRLADLTIECDQPGVKVNLDGQLLFTGPGRSASTLLAGKHVIVASREGFITNTKTLVLGSGEKQRLRLRLLPLSKAVKMKRRFSIWMPWTVMTIGAVVAAVGVPLILKANSYFGQYNDLFSEECPRGCASQDRSPTLVSLDEKGSAYRASAYALFGVGGAVAAAGITLIVLNIPRAVRVAPKESLPGPPPTPGPSVRILPALGPGHYGVTAEWKF